MTSSLRKFALGALLLIFSWTAQSAISLSDPLPINPLLKIGKLDNGLTYYIQQNSQPQKRVELRLVVKAGSILEDDDQQGLAHFTEHMAFNGSRHFKKHELISYLQSIGIKFGADLNAYTSFDETVYILPIPTDKKENLEKGFLVLEDWAHNLTLNDADIDAERNIILEEARIGKGATERMYRQLFPALFNGSRYADRLPIGKEDIIAHFKYDALKRFYADWYRPDLMAVIIVGDISPPKAEQMIKKHFAHIKNPFPERPRIYATIPPRTTSSSLVITDKEATGNMQLIQFSPQPIRPDTTLGDYRKSLIKQLSSAMLNQRLQDLTQQATPPFFAANSSMSPLARGFQSFSSSAMIGRSGAEPAIFALVQENERARQFGFNESELERAKKTWQRTIKSSYNERNKTDSADLVGEYIRHFLTDETIPGIANEYAYVAEFLPGISLDEVNQYTKTTIPDNAPFLAAYLGSSQEKEIIPTQTELAKWVTAAEKVAVVGSDASVISANLMTQPPETGHIVSETNNKQLGITELTLSNGLKVILKPTDFKSDQIILTAARFGGQSLFDDADTFNARYANAVVEKMGLATFSPSDLQKILAGKSIAFQVDSNNWIDNVAGYTSSTDIETFFQYLHLRLAKSRIDPDLYHAFINQMEDASKNSMAKPESIFSNTVLSTLYDHHPRLPLIPKPTDFKQVSLDRTTAIFNHRFTSAKGFTFILAGNFQIAAIKPLIATYLASLPTTEIETAFHDLHIRPLKGVVKKDVYSGTEPKSRVAIIFTGETIYSKEEAMRFNALIEIMNLRFTDVLREKLRLIYSGGMSGSIERIPYQHYRLNINLPCSPDNVDQVIASTFSEIKKIRQDGPTQEELNKVKVNWIKNNAIALRTNEKWIAGLQEAALYNTDPSEILTTENRINALTLTDIKEAAQHYLTMDNYMQGVLYPEKN